MFLTRHIVHIDNSTAPPSDGKTVGHKYAIREKTIMRYIDCPKCGCP